MVLLFSMPILRPQLFSKKLCDVSPEKCQIAETLNKSPQFTKGRVEFWVRYDFEGALVDILYPSEVFISPSYLEHPYLDVVLAHELGHIEYGVLSSSESDADRFAVKLRGKDRVLAAMSMDGISEKRKNAVKNMKE
ncbi:MAG: hypothetical protein HYT67_00985 [Candidatus Yanofskybacteria bacterium]|nr:hypothetical protein [Candidatus Yanofskybacteria bacterium]